MDRENETLPKGTFPTASDVIKEIIRWFEDQSSACAFASTCKLIRATLCRVAKDGHTARYQRTLELGLLPNIVLEPNQSCVELSPSQFCCILREKIQRSDFGAWYPRQSGGEWFFITIFDPYYLVKRDEDGNFQTPSMAFEDFHSTPGYSYLPYTASVLPRRLAAAPVVCAQQQPTSSGNPGAETTECFCIDVGPPFTSKWLVFITVTDTSRKALRISWFSYSNMPEQGPKESAMDYRKRLYLASNLQLDLTNQSCVVKFHHVYEVKL